MPRNYSYVKYMMRPVSQTNVTQKTNATVTFNPCALLVVAGIATGVVPGGSVSCVGLAASMRVGVTPSEVIWVAAPEVERPCRARKPTDVDDESGSGSWTPVPCHNGTESGC